MRRTPLSTVAVMAALLSLPEETIAPFPLLDVAPPPQPPHPADVLPLTFRDSERIRAAEAKRAHRAAKRRKP